MKFLIILEAVKNRRICAFCLEFSDKICGLEMMLLPPTSTMLGSTRFLECPVGVFDVWLEFFVVYRKVFPLTYLVFLRNDILGIQLPRMNIIVETVLCQFFTEFHAIRNILLHKFSSRPFHTECCHQVFFFFLKKKFCSYLQVSELVLQFFARTARPCKSSSLGMSKINRVFKLHLRPNATLMELGWSPLSATSRFPEAGAKRWSSYESIFSECYFLVLLEA